MGSMGNATGTRRTIVASLGVWTLGTTLGSGSIIGAWVLGLGGPVKLAANLFWLVALPGWMLAYRIGGVGVRENPIAIVAVNAAVWAFLTLLLVTGWCITGSLLARKDGRAPRTSGDGRPIDGSRRAFLTRSLGGASVVLAGAAAPSYATLVEPRTLRVRRETVPIPGLPESLEGLRIAQVSDTHLGPRIPESIVRRAYERVAQLGPDLVVHTGDHYHDGVRDIDRGGALCAILTRAASIGTLGVLGNHDHWGDADRMTHSLVSAGVRVIDNDRVWIDAQARSLTTHRPRNGALRIVGLGDLTDGVVDPDRAYRDETDPRAADTPTIVLAHNPDTAEHAVYRDPAGPRCDLMLSGHTHGGQVRIPFLGTPIVPSSYGQRYAGGLCRGPRFPVHVSRGVGMSILPVRFGVPPEVSLITLTRRA